MHEGLLVEGVEEGTGNIADALGNNPDDGCCRHAVDEWFEGYQHAEAHADKAERLDVGMLLQLHKADNGAGNGTQPYKGE